MQPKQVRISALELAKVAFPGVMITSGAGQEYLRRLDRLFQPSGYRALLHPRPWASGPIITDIDDSGHAFNVTEAEARRIVRS